MTEAGGRVDAVPATPAAAPAVPAVRAAPAVPVAEVATLLREILSGQRQVRPLDPRRLWSMTAFGPCALLCDGWRLTFQADDGGLDRIESVAAPDGRQAGWTEWLAAGEVNPADALDAGEFHELEARLRECR